MLCVFKEQETERILSYSGTTYSISLKESRMWTKGHLQLTKSDLKKLTKFGYYSLREQWHPTLKEIMTVSNEGDLGVPLCNQRMLRKLLQYSGQRKVEFQRTKQRTPKDRAQTNRRTVNRGITRRVN